MRRIEWCLKPREGGAIDERYAVATGLGHRVDCVKCLDFAAVWRTDVNEWIVPSPVGLDSSKQYVSQGTERVGWERNKR